MNSQRFYRLSTVLIGLLLFVGSASTSMAMTSSLVPGATYSKGGDRGQADAKRSQQARQQQNSRAQRARQQQNEREAQRVEAARRQQEQQRASAARRQQEQQRAAAARKQQEAARVQAARQQQAAKRVQVAREKQERQRMEAARTKNAKEAAIDKRDQAANAKRVQAARTQNGKANHGQGRGANGNANEGRPSRDEMGKRLQGDHDARDWAERIRSARKQRKNARIRNARDGNNPSTSTDSGLGIVRPNASMAQSKSLMGRLERLERELGTRQEGQTLSSRLVALRQRLSASN
ncbi:MAG: membrane protein involved in colicin uptake [Candidatus Paceibacteria bacterium]|jgi:membrane protein involved in colicin uptake